MNSKKDIIEIVLLGAILVVLVLILGFTGIKTKIDNSNKIEVNDNLFGETNNNNNNNEEKKEVDSDKKNENDKNSNSNNLIDSSQNNNSQDNVSDDKENVTTNNNNNNNSDNNIKPNDKDNESSNLIDKPNNNGENNKNENINLKESENDVVTYLTSLENKLDTYNNNEDDKNFREKAKDIFITTVDFLFYDGKIKGYTFDELSTTTKLEVLKIIASIDNKIDSYFPNYKDTIKEKATNFKGKIAILYLETTNKFCEKVGEETCQEARDDFNNMKNSFGYTWNIIKESLTNSKDKLSVILSEWYKSIK